MNVMKDLSVSLDRSLDVYTTRGFLSLRLDCSWEGASPHHGHDRHGR